MPSAEGCARSYLRRPRETAPSALSALHRLLAELERVINSERCSPRPPRRSQPLRAHLAALLRRPLGMQVIRVRENFGAASHLLEPSPALVQARTPQRNRPAYAKH